MSSKLTLDLVPSWLKRYRSHYHMCEHLHNIIVHISYEYNVLCSNFVFSSAHHMTVLVILSYAFFKSMKTICRSFFYSLYLSISWCSNEIASVVDLSGIKPNWFLVTFGILLKQFSMTLPQSFVVWIISLIHW
jgi:hypothetical protein